MKAIRVLCIFLCCVATGGLAQEVSIYGPVKPNETLYRIALDHRHQGMTVAQMMMSIFERNPQAFEQDNINRLRVGSLLQIPSPESVATFDAGNAYQDASQQIDTYESEVRELRVERGELPELGDAAREPDLMPSVAVAGVTSPSDQEIAEMKQTLAQDQTQALPTPSLLPPPKPPQRKKKAEEPTAASPITSSKPSIRSTMSNSKSIPATVSRCRRDSRRRSIRSRRVWAGSNSSIPRCATRHCCRCPPN